MSWSNTASQVQIGDDVYGSDGDKVGTVADVQSTYLVIEKGFFFPTDYYIPVEAITQVSDGRIVLNVSKDVALNSGWDTVPETTAMPVRETDTIATGVAPDTALYDTTAHVGVEPELAAYESTDEDEIVIPLREEELTASVREVEAGAARIQKRVVSEERVLEVPVTEEQIRVERRVVDRAAGVNDVGAFEEIVIEVPLTEQEVELHKQSRVTEELVVSKEEIQRTEQVRGTVRREEVDVVEEDLTTESFPDSRRQI